MIEVLFGESEGKDHKGIFPASVIFSTDLHSMGQFVQDGTRNLFETVIAFAQLRKPIMWGNQKVSTVFLPSVSETDLPVFGTLLTNLIGHMYNDHLSRRLAQVHDFQSLMELL